MKNQTMDTIATLEYLKKRYIDASLYVEETFARDDPQYAEGYIQACRGFIRDIDGLLYDERISSQ